MGPVTVRAWRCFSQSAIKMTKRLAEFYNLCPLIQYCPLERLKAQRSPAI